MGDYLKAHKRMFFLVLAAGLVLLIGSWLRKEATLLLLGLLLLNTYSFILAWKDKRAAKKHDWRVPEASLWTAAILGGAAGLWAAMLLFRHKTKHLSFRLGVPAVICLHVWLALAMIR
ncbi:DUF1294 domain-containing protein [Brevibacillus migulae]|uniref:DUF1294 domain-containing protein n=1 Tax=Brevibacillus migulae TaxID=1644114 RepID=UPI001F2DAD42|nr:DUF1294 domain-containing protein [Brevibacillus migulae]